MPITVTVNGLTVTGEPKDIRQLVGFIDAGGTDKFPTKRGPGRPPKAVSATDGVQAKPKKALSPAAQKARELHGQYLGLTRSLSATQKATVKKIRAEKGVEASINAAREMSEAAKKKAGK